MRVDIWSDMGCPFCYVGKRHLEAALERFAHAGDVDVVWHSFQLNPDMPQRFDGDLHEYLARKLGRTPQEARAMNDRVSAMAAQAGLEYDLDHVVPANSFDAHRLVQLGAQHGVADDVLERLFAAYFTQGAVLTDPETLVAIGVAAGLEAGEIRELLGSDRFADAVRADVALGADLGLTGVPAFVIDRRYGVIGAQPVDTLVQALETAWAERETAPA